MHDPFPRTCGQLSDAVYTLLTFQIYAQNMKGINVV